MLSPEQTCSLTTPLLRIVRRYRERCCNTGHTVDRGSCPEPSRGTGQFMWRTFVELQPCWTPAHFTITSGTCRPRRARTAGVSNGIGPDVWCRLRAAPPWFHQTLSRRNSLGWNIRNPTRAGGFRSPSAQQLSHAPDLPSPRLQPRPSLFTARYYYVINSDKARRRRIQLNSRINCVFAETLCAEFTRDPGAC